MDENIIGWSIETLRALGFELQNNPTCIKKAPWSKIYVLSTPKGKIYLKQTTPPFHLEAEVIHQLLQLKCEHIPNLLSKNNEYNAFLMHDDGFPLREQLKKSYHPQYAIDALTKYQNIQQKSAVHIEKFISFGLADWRITNIPFLFKIFLNNKDLLIQDGLTNQEINMLQQLIEVIDNVCNKINTYPIPATIEHGDFHDNNILIKNKKLTILDWGDSIISHPFFSLTSFIWSAKRNHCLPGNICRFIEDDYLKLWGNFCTYQETKELYKLIKIVHPIKFSLGFSRISECNNHMGMGEFKGHISSALRYFILHQNS